MTGTVSKKVVAYITQGDKLLVFSHPFQPAAGIQVPGGSMKEGESPEEAVMREAREETGLDELVLCSFLGVCEFDLSSYGRDEILRRRFYHLEFRGETPATWRHYETEPSDGSPGPITLEFFWAELPDGVPLLIAGQGALLSALTGVEQRGVADAPQPIITPEKWLGSDRLPPDLHGCSLAVLAFCRFHEMLAKLSAEPPAKSLLSHMDRSHQFVGRVGDRKVLAVECVYGGPLSATVVEELAHYGIKQIIGYGYAGSLTKEIPIGEIALADTAFVSDGTSREYLPGDRFVYPDQVLFHHLDASAARIGLTVRGAKVWTTDALYREYPEKIAAWRHAGAELVNMDTSHFYAVSKVVGAAAVYACVVSDSVEGPEWDDGFGRIQHSMKNLQDLVLESLNGIAV